MKLNFKSGRQSLLETALSLGCIFVSGIHSASAAQIYWDGIPTGGWENAANWSTATNAATPNPAAPPGAADDAIFNIAGANGASVISLNGPQAAQSLVFNSTGATTIEAGAAADVLSLGSGGITVGGTAGPVTLGGATGVTVTLTADQTWNVASAEPLVLLNPIASAGTMGAGAGLVKTGPGTLWLNNTANTHTINGTLNVQEGIVQASGDLFVGGLIGSGVIENGGSANKWFFVNSPENQTFSGTIRNGAARLGLVKRGAGTLTLTGSLGPELDTFAVENGRIVLPTGASVSVGGSGFGSANIGNTGNVANNGVLEITGGTFTAARNNNPGFTVGAGNNGRGFVRMTSGTLNVTEQLKVGNGSGAGSEAHAGFVMDSGTVTSGAWLVVGLNNDRALFEQNGGSVQVLNNRMTIGAGGGASIGVVNLNGGTFQVNAGGNTGIFLGENGTGTLNVMGSELTLASNGGTNSGTMQFAGAASSLAGHLNLHGGSLSTFGITKGGSTATGVYRVNFHGGTLRAVAPNSNFFADLPNTDAYVYAGGATIDNQGHDVTIRESFRAPTGNGVSAAGLTVSGGGYLYPPLVTVTGGGGTGATAIATIDGGGNLTGIEMTNPGINYTSPPTFALVGGGAGNTGTVAGTASLVANTSGGMTFNGSGITMLAGAENSFTGPVTVNGGTVGLGGSYTGAIQVANGAGLAVADFADGIGSLTVPTLNLANGTVTLDTAGGTTSETITVSTPGGLTLGTVGIRLMDSETGNPATAGTYTLFSYQGTLGGNISGLSVANPRDGYNYSFANSGNALTVQVTSVDTDGDGMPDAYETANGLDPNSASGVNGAEGNLDGDFATNFEEFLADTAANDPNDDPLNLDNDGLPDAWEIANFGSIAAQTGAGDFDGDFDSNQMEFTNETAASDPGSFSDTDEDGLGDGWETTYFSNLTAKDGTADSDSDGFTDLEEYGYGSDPTDSSFSPVQARLAHRWSFNGDLIDSVGESDATIQNGTNSSANPATVGATAVTMTGGAKADSQWVSLGSNLLPKKNTPVTIELWATHDAVQNWSRVFDFHSGTGENLFIAWTMGTGEGSDRVEWRDAGGVLTSDNTNGGFFVGSPYHIVLTIEPSPTAPGSSLVKWYSGVVDGEELGEARGTITVANNLARFNDVINALGFSPYGDNTASATYDEVRIWDGVLPSWAIEGFHSQGPDDASQADSDADGLPDAFETYYFGDLSQTATQDLDNDQSTNREELLTGSDPNDPFSSPNDTDGDGLPDAWEIAHFGNLTEDGFGDFDGDYAFNDEELAAGSDPSDYFSFPDVDEDGMSDGWEMFFLAAGMADDGTTDEDGDTFTSLQEFLAMADPADPVSPGSPDGDADNDGLPDRWEIFWFSPNPLNAQSGSDDSDGDGDTNLVEYQATSDPLDPDSTATDINGDGLPDQQLFLDMTAIGSGIQDKDGQATPFTHRLPNTGTAIPAVDPNLDLDTTAGTLAITTSTSDINGQVNMPALEALGLPLASLGFTGNQDFRIRARYVNIPAMGGFDQIGAYVGTSSTAVTRSSTIGGTHQALGVNTDGAGDSAAFFGADGTAGGPGQDLIVVIERIDGVWSMFTNDSPATPTAQPEFLNGTAALQAGVFVLDGASGDVHKTAILDSFTIVRFGSPTGGGGDADDDGMDDAWEQLWFGNSARDGSGDFDNDGANDLSEFAFNSTPTAGGSLPAIGSAISDTNANNQDELTITVPVRSGATFAAGPNGSQIATVDGLTYRVAGTLDLQTFNSPVTHVGSVPSSSDGYDLHTFRLDASEGLAGKGFLQATATPAAP